MITKETLAAIPFFSDIPERELELIVPLCRLQEGQEGDYLIHEGVQVSSIYFSQGKLECIRRTKKERICGWPRWGKASSLASCRSSTRVRPLHPSEQAAPSRRWSSTKRRYTGCSTVSRAWATKYSRPWLDTRASAYGKPTRCWRGFPARHATSLLCEGTEKSCLSPFAQLFLSTPAPSSASDSSPARHRAAALGSSAEVLYNPHKPLHF